MITAHAYIRHCSRVGLGGRGGGREGGERDGRERGEREREIGKWVSVFYPVRIEELEYFRSSSLATAVHAM